MLTETWINGMRISYGLTRAVYPRLTANDPAARSLGYFVNGTTIVNQTNGNGTALAEKQFGDWRSIWSASPELPSCILTKFAREAGVHIYSERGDQVFTGPGWFGLHSKLDGELTVPFAQAGLFENVITGEKTTVPSRELHLKLKRGETVLYRMF